MDLIEVDQEESGRYSLWLEAGTTDVDDVIAELGHEPNGYFWDGIVQLLVASEAAALKDRFESDPEAGAYCAYSEDRTVIEDLAARLQAVATNEDRLRQLVDLADTTGFEFDD
ncbi:Imm51 family immunity protein [Actinoplanes sp. NPDC024001]|uniref:Imm51 family immunity protein n=1 Tax=Actinoplanes sp. NPDC024001 TaxID=3154598 RepID=UPI0033D6781B